MAGERAQLSLPLGDDHAPAAAAPPPAPPSPPDAGSAGPAVSPPADDTVHFVRRRGTRRYVLRLMDDGTLRVTVPWWGSRREARAFVASQADWIARQRARRAWRAAAAWTAGASVLVEGDARPLVADGAGRLLLDGHVVAAASAGPRDVRRAVHDLLRARARRDLPPALLALAASHDIVVTGVSIRNQVSRWGSCSRRGAISLNWRLVQVPPFVRDYVLLHELMHRRELNHSARFWRLVADVCPRYVEARAWLRGPGAQLFD
jgi:predicted metal-dependent hydrolase